MIYFFRNNFKNIIAAGTERNLLKKDIDKLIWLFGNATMIEKENVKGVFVGPRKEMITPWSTNAVEITQNMGVKGISRVEEFFPSRIKKPPLENWLHIKKEKKSIG